MDPSAQPLVVLLSLVLVLAVGCAPVADPDAETAADRPLVTYPEDPHSFSNPNEVSVEHLTLDLTVDFELQRLDGSARLDLANRGSDRLVLDTRDLDVHRVVLHNGDRNGEETTFELGESDPDLGRALTIDIEPTTSAVTIDYTTRPQAAALQWLGPEQTSGESPFLFSQSQAILARTWIPLQDTPAVRFTYDATIRAPENLLALMSAVNPQEKTADGVYRFEMSEPVPSYLMAISVGDLEFRSLGERSGVYAEPSVVEAAADEFADTENMIDAAERLYGPYRWGRYDILVLPPAFPFGGMENPRLTFATPTILAGDRSLVALIAHELAHSWSGNLVTNATWNDFWLNEGFTVYFERRIMEELRGEAYADMLAQLGRQDLDQTVAELPDVDSHLYLELADRDPDDGMTEVAYEKGALFLRTLEEKVGRERLDAFLAEYFDTFAFQSMDTVGFLDYLDRELLEPEGLTREDIGIQAWVYGPGVPEGAAVVTSDAFSTVEGEIERWRSGTPASDLSTADWTTHEWLHFLRSMPDSVGADEMAKLDAAFGFSDSGNSEILAAWLLLAIDRDYEPADPALERFLTSQGRRKFLKPLYEELAKTEEGMERARAIYAQARPGYHSVSTGTIDEILDWEG